MSTKEKTSKPKKVRSKKADEAAIKAANAADPDIVEEPLPSLPKKPAKVVQETFRCTKEEHGILVRAAAAEGFESMGAFYRTKLGLTGG